MNLSQLTNIVVQNYWSLSGFDENSIQINIEITYFANSETSKC